MKNVRKNQIKTCIFLEKEELEKIILNESGEKVKIRIEDSGMWYENLDNQNREDSYYQSLLEKYFDAKISTIHIDDCLTVGIWIVLETNNAIDRKISVVKELVDEILDVAPSEDEGTDDENELYAEFQNLKEAIEQFTQN